MGMLDDVLNSAVPKGNLAKPLMIAAAALLASGALHKQSSPSAPSVGKTPAEPSGDLLAGLGGLLERFQQSGQSDIIKSWVGSGQNTPIAASQLAAVLGPSIIKALAAKSGMSEQDLTSQLSQILPNIVDQLTPNGRLPTPTEIAQSR